ncbi:hypothetical protein IJ768_03720 [Candidatus Saccharibacteria bacterium]|nr:hypothetical protein [Candidatus Saccharibacteria bacterium]
MKKHAKILGSIGAAAAVSMGIFAVTSPVMAQDLVPLDYKNNNNTSADVEVKLKVVGETPIIDIDSPLDGAVIIGKEFSVDINYEHANQLDYRLIYVAEDGTRTTYDLPSKIVVDTGVSDGSDAFDLDASDYGGKYGTYILEATANGAGSTTDSVMFKLISFDFTVKGIEESTNNPIITIVEAPVVYKSLIQVFDEDDNAIFEEPIEVILNEGAETDVTLPLAKYGVPEGQYRIVAVPYDEDGNIIDASKEHSVHYTPAPAPEVPDTGSILENLGLSRQDLISTGLALLFVCAFFGVLIIAKKNRKEKQNRH